jgi:hypothetical protein
VTIAPAAASDDPSDHPRMSMTKHFSGDLDATARGTMLTVTTAIEGSAVYVALERVTGSLGGRSGSFDLVHRGVMTRGAPDLSIMVVPDSGTDELAGLAGTMEIEIRDGRHFYRFDYRLP